MQGLHNIKEKILGPSFGTTTEEQTLKEEKLIEEEPIPEETNIEKIQAPHT
jgi:hypothetical protein